MAKKKSKPCNKKSCEKKCNRVEPKEDVVNEIPVVEISPKTNQFLGLIKRVFGYE